MMAAKMQPKAKITKTVILLADSFTPEIDSTWLLQQKKKSTKTITAKKQADSAYYETLSIICRQRIALEPAKCSLVQMDSRNLQHGVMTATWLFLVTATLPISRSNCPQPKGTKQKRKRLPLGRGPTNFLWRPSVVESEEGKSHEKRLARENAPR